MMTPSDRRGRDPSAGGKLATGTGVFEMRPIRVDWMMATSGESRPRRWHWLPGGQYPRNELSAFRAPWGVSLIRRGMCLASTAEPSPSPPVSINPSASTLESRSDAWGEEKNKKGCEREEGDISCLESVALCSSTGVFEDIFYCASVLCAQILKK